MTPLPYLTEEEYPSHDSPIDLLLKLVGEPRFTQDHTTNLPPALPSRTSVDAGQHLLGNDPDVPQQDLHSTSVQNMPQNEDSSSKIIRRPLVIVESPYAGDVEYNIAYAKRAVHDCMARGEAPIASHLLFTQPGILDDNNPAERYLGIECGLAWYQAKVLVVAYVDLGISNGMRKALEYADLTKTPIEYRTIGRNPQ